MPNKGDIVNEAYSLLKVSGLVVNPDPNLITVGIKTMNAMIASWVNKGICVNYNPSPSYFDIDSGEDSGLHDNTIFAVVNNLAKRLCSNIGKDCPIQVLADAKDSLDGLYNIELTQRDSTPYLPYGQGNTNDYWRPRYFSVDREFDQNCATENLDLNAISKYITSWASWLEFGSTIISYTITPSDGLEISEDQIQNDSTEVFYKAKAVQAGDQSVIIDIVTSISTPEIADTQKIEFNVISTT